MIAYEMILIGEELFCKTYSDEGYYIEREGVLYTSALDPYELSREYTETDIKIGEDDKDDI